jgi:hypothetical protein
MVYGDPTKEKELSRMSMSLQKRKEANRPIKKETGIAKRLTEKEYRTEGKSKSVDSK